MKMWLWVHRAGIIYLRSAIHKNWKWKLITFWGHIDIHHRINPPSSSDADRFSEQVEQSRWLKDHWICRCDRSHLVEWALCVMETYFGHLDEILLMELSQSKLHKYLSHSLNPPYQLMLTLWRSCTAWFPKTYDFQKAFLRCLCSNDSNGVINT